MKKEPIKKEVGSVEGSAASVSEIPDDWFVCAADLDAETPFVLAQQRDSTDNKETKFLVPPQLAYYLRTHYCGSATMHNALIEQGKYKVRTKVKDALGIK